jgi:hypothetical protein
MTGRREWCPDALVYAAICRNVRRATPGLA